MWKLTLISFLCVDLGALELVDESYQNRIEWIKKSINTTAKMGKFSSDRAILDYAQECWVRSRRALSTVHLWLCVI